jgi:hydrogenase-4 component F
MHYDTALWLSLLVPFVLGFACTMLPSARTALAAMCCCVFATAIAGSVAIAAVFQQGTIFIASRWLFLDALSAYHYAVLLVVFCLSSVYAWFYFGEELRTGHFTRKQARLFSGLSCFSLAAMTLVLFSNNLGIMWIGIEATTLITAFLICIYVSRQSMEAMWKYIVICSVGMAFAFMGTLLIAVSAKALELGPHDSLLWSVLHENARLLDPRLIQTAFIFLLVGYGTKAGLAPMHSWLPDAHMQAPSPVSAIFSGFLLSTAMYCIMRYMPLIEAATGNAGWGRRLMTGFGLFSIAVAAVFIVSQKNLKRFLAYSSIEHIGIIALGLGLGGLGTFAALFHTLNHGLCKTLSFFAAGRMGQVFGTYDIQDMKGALARSPVWGAGLFLAILALIGAAPFALFISEFLILKAAIDQQAFAVAFVFLLGIGIVFICALGYVLPLSWGGPPLKETAPARYFSYEALLVYVPLAALLVLGVWMPEILQSVLNRAAHIISGAAVYDSANGFRP